MSDIVSELRKIADEFEEIQIFYSLKQLKIRYVTSQTVRSIQLFLAARKVGLRRLAVQDFADLNGTTQASALQTLHTLGDKGILTLETCESGKYRFVLSEKFLQMYESTEKR